MIDYLLCFILMFALDFIWAAYTNAITANRALKSSCYASVIVALNGIVTVSYVHEPKLIFAVLLGAFAGTFAAVWWKNRRLPALRTAFDGEV